MTPSKPSHAAPSLRRRRRRGISVVLVVIVLVVLIAFASLAVDVGRVRVAKVQLQTAADSAATAAASGMEMFPTRGVLEPQDRAVDAAGRNFSIDQSQSDGERRDAGVELVVDEDVQFGRWDADTRTFTKIEHSGGGMDKRRQADAIRVWTRRVTRFRDDEGTVIVRGNGLQLILAPVLGVHTGEIQGEATATLNGNVDVAAFVGLDDVNFTGATKSDSYNAAIENYPGSSGPNRNTSIASNREVSFAGAATIWGSVYPGRNYLIQPQPLRSSLTITGYMFPLTKVLAATTPGFGVPTQPDAVPGEIEPADAVSGNNALDPKNDPVFLRSKQQPGDKPTNFVFSAWTLKGSDVVTIDNTDSAVDIWIMGDFSSRNSAQVRIEQNVNPVRFHINGDMDLRGGGMVRVTSGGRPRDVEILMSRPGSTLRIGGNQPLQAHVIAPSSDVNFVGNGTGFFHFFGRAIGRTLTVASNVELHYDESLGTQTDPKFQIRLVE